MKRKELAQRMESDVEVFSNDSHMALASIAISLKRLADVWAPTNPRKTVVVFEPPTPRDCKFCGITFQTGKGTGKRLHAKFCSDQHRIDFHSLKRSRP